MLKEQIQKDMIEAMKAKEEAKVSTLRMLKAAVLKFEVSGERKEADDTEVMNIIAKEAKQRKDSIEEYKAGNRPELAAKEEIELGFLQAYLPKQMSEEEVTAIVKEVLAQTGATSKADIGKVMGALMPKVKGKADGGMVNRIVSGLLS